MSDEVIHGLSADSKRVPSKWTRNTVADGSWLQNYTLSPLSARDFYLASAIDANTDDLLAKLEAEIEARKEGDNYISATLVSVSGDLVNVSSDFYDFSAKVENSASVINNTINVFSGKVEASADALDRKIDNETTRAQSKEDELLNKINTIEAGTDVINVFGSYGGENGFSVESAYYFDPDKTAYHLTNNDVIKIINDEYTPVGDTENLTTGHQTYYQWVNKSTVTGDPTSPADGDWNFIGYTDPYYNISEINNIVSDLSSTISSNYYSAKNVKAGNNISAKYSTNGAQTVTLGLSSTILLDGVSSTNLSSQFVTAVNLSSNKVSASNLSATTISASELSATKVSAYNLSATNISAANLSSTNVSAENLSATKLSASSFSADDIIAKNIYASIKLSAESATIKDATITYVTGTTAKFNGFSGTNISGTQSASNIDELIGSAGSAYKIVKNAQYSAVQGNTSLTGYLSAGFKISAGDNLILNTSNNTITLDSLDTGLTSISAVGNGLSNSNATYTKTLILSANSGIKFTSASTNKLCIDISAQGNNGKISAIGGSALSAQVLQRGKYIEVNGNQIDLSANISATNISSQTFTISGADGSKKESVSSTQDTIQLIEKYPGTYTYTTTITPKSYSAEYSVGGGGGWVGYDYGHVSANSYGGNPVSISWTNLIKAGNGDFNGIDVSAQSFNTSSDNAGYGIVNIYTDWSNAGAGGTDATGSAGLNGCVVWSNGNYTAHNYDNDGGNWASWNDIIKTSNSRWVSGNGITAIVSGTVGAATGVLYFV